MTTPLSLTGKYQLVIFESTSTAGPDTPRLLAAMNAALQQLGVNHRKFLVPVLPGTSGIAIDGKMPSVAVFFGSGALPALSADDTARLTRLLSDGNLIIPVVPDLTGFTAQVPASIAHLNGYGLADCGADFERLAARVLEGFGLLRERRRLFISYRRAETSGVATQLYEALDRAGFDVFLDTHGVIGPGEPFQEVLWHRLADTDVAVILDSPGFLASRWTEEELARANSSTIQILQVLWPDQLEGATAAFSTFHPLTTGDFAGSGVLGPTALLVDACVTQIVDEVEGLRARALGARHAFLVREFSGEARNAGLAVQTTLERTLIVSTAAGQRVMVQPAIGIPDAEGYQALEGLHQRDLTLGRTYSQPPVLLFDQTGIRTRWLTHLGWLNTNLACARSVSLAEAKGWLEDFARAGSP